MAEFVVMKNKGGQEATVAKSAFERVWKQRGWTVKNEGPTSASSSSQESTKPPNPTR